MMRLKRTIDALAKRLAPPLTGPAVELWLPSDGSDADLEEPAQDFCPRPGEPIAVVLDETDPRWVELWPPAAASPDEDFPFLKNAKGLVVAPEGQPVPIVALARAGGVPLQPETRAIVPAQEGETPSVATAVQHDGDTGVPTTPPSPPPIPAAVERPNPLHGYLVAEAVRNLKAYGE